MGVFDILVLAAALSMDAVAVSMTDGMSEPSMPLKNRCRSAGFSACFRL